MSRFRKLVERIPEMHNAQYYWVVQYNIIRTELRKVSAQLTTTGEGQEREGSGRQAGADEAGGGRGSGGVETGGR